MARSALAAGVFQEAREAVGSEMKWFSEREDLTEYPDLYLRRLEVTPRTHQPREYDVITDVNAWSHAPTHIVESASYACVTESARVRERQQCPTYSS